MQQVTVESLPGTKEGVSVLRVNGPLTIHNFFDFQDLSRKNTSPVLVVDLSEVPYMDSAALGCLLGIHVSCERKGRKYALANVCERLEKMFEICGVQGVLARYPSIAAAEAALI